MAQSASPNTQIYVCHTSGGITSAEDLIHQSTKKLFNYFLIFQASVSLLKSITIVRPFLFFHMLAHDCHLLYPRKPGITQTI